MIGPYLIDSVVQKQYKGEDKYGTPVATTDVTVKARIDYKNRQITSLSGEIVVSMAKILIRELTIVRAPGDFATRATSTIAYEDKFTFDGVDHAVVRIARQADFRTRFMEVYVA